MTLNSILLVLKKLGGSLSVGVGVFHWPCCCFIVSISHSMPSYKPKSQRGTGWVSIQKNQRLLRAWTIGVALTYLHRFVRNRPECSRVGHWFNSGVKFLQFHLRASLAPSLTYWQRPGSAHLLVCRQPTAFVAHCRIRPPFDGYRKSRRRRLCSPSCHSSSTSALE